MCSYCSYCSYCCYVPGCVVDVESVDVKLTTRMRMRRSASADSDTS